MKRSRCSGFTDTVIRSWDPNDKYGPKGRKGDNGPVKAGEELRYEITIENPERVERGVAWMEMDGRRLEDRVIPLEERLIKHRVRVRLGTGEEPAAGETAGGVAGDEN